VASGQISDPETMIRFVLSPDGMVTPDITGKLPGRGVWVSADRASLEKAIKTKGFARGFKTAVQMPDDLMDLVEASLVRQVLGLIGMARKSGQLILGFDQVYGAARGTALAWRIEARDGSEDGRGKIRTLSKAIAREMELPLPKVIGCFTSAELSQVLGKERVIHAAIPTSKLARGLKDITARLSGFRDLIPPEWPDVKHENKAETRALGPS